jgi:hypothetical protein
MPLGAVVCGARGIEGGQGPVGGSQEAVKRVVCALVITRDRSRRVDGRGVDLLLAKVAIGGIEFGEGAVAGPHEALLCAACVIVASRGHPSRVDGYGLDVCALGGRASNLV